MPQSAWFSFKKMVESLKRDYPMNFIEGPHSEEESWEDAIITWDKNSNVVVAMPCSDVDHPKFFKTGRLHRHTNGRVYIIVAPNGGQAVVSQE